MNAAPFPRADITGVILAGGQGRRMGGMDKGLVPVNGIPMVAHVVRALRAEIDTVLINANRNSGRYADLGCPVVADIMDGYLGPLAGMASGMRAARTTYVVTAPCDSPLLGTGLVQRLYRTLAQENADISVARDGERMHPVFALIRCDLLPDLLDYLNSGERKIDRWYARHHLAVTDFGDVPDWFRNVNRPEERAELENRIEVSAQ